jgi:uncharacterized protein
MTAIQLSRCLFVSDLHGRPSRWRAFCRAIERDAPRAAFVGGDFLPPTAADRFLDDARAALEDVRGRLGASYPRVFLILGNDDPRACEADVIAAGDGGLWEYAHGRAIAWDAWRVLGYACVPPTPFQLKDWERYDVSRFVDPGCVSPEEGRRSVAVDAHEIRHATIARDLDVLAPDGALADTICLFHAPPYRTALDRAALDGRFVDHAPLDVHVGSIAIRRFIESRQPAVTLHGHIHESARITGRWLDRLGATVAISAAHDGDELALVRFDPARPAEATRELI